MDYEKKYREALEIAKSLYDQHDVDWKDEDIEAIFPELKESEDEKVRKKIIEHIRWCEDDGNCAKEGSQRWIAWLEKQGEQKSADKVEPKFHNGEWVVNTVGDTNKVVKVWDDGYTLDDNTFLSNSWATEHYHLWTIQDVKDGDVLCYKDEISIYKHNIENCTKQGKTFGGFVYHCCYDGKRFIINSLYSLTEQDKINIHPATKEQRNILFQRMKEAGYEWDEESLLDLIKFIENWKVKGKDSTAKLALWTSDEQKCDRLLTFLKSLRPQSTWRPSEEMLEALYKTIPENVIAMSEDEMLLDKLYQGLKYGRVLSKN